VDVGSDIDIDADVEILELGIDEGVDADTADTGLERTGGYGHAVTDFEDAFWPSKARICGFWMSLVLLSLNSAVTEACGMVTWKSVAFR